MNSSEERELREQVILTESRARSNSHRLEELESDFKDLKKSEMVVYRHDEEIKELKAQANNYHKLVVNQEVMTHTLKTMAEDNRRQMDSFAETLVNVNENLTSLNSSNNQISSEMQTMKNEIVSTKNHVKEVEELAQSNKESMNFNVVKFLTSDATKVIATAILVLILSYIGLK